MDVLNGRVILSFLVTGATDSLAVGRDLLIGTYSATDAHFRVLELILDPPSPLGVTPTPSVVEPVRPSTGVSGSWQLDTTNLDPCGYVVRMRTWDTTIVSEDPVGWEGPETAKGFSIQ